MGLFSKKKVYKKEVIPSLMMAIALDMVGKLQAFNDLDDDYTVAVNVGYFYGFLRLQLSNLTTLKLADEMIEESIRCLGEALDGKIEMENFIYVVRTNYNNSFQNIKRAGSSSDIFECAAQLYLDDLYQKRVNDEVKLAVSKANIHALYGMIVKMTANMKIK